MEPLPQPARSGRTPRTFKIHRCVGRGGFGEVYQATAHGDGPPAEVALKLLHAGPGAAAEAVERLRDERRMLGLLDHPAILVAHELAVLEGRIALVTEYVDGQDLSEILTSGPVPAAVALAVAERVAGALAAAADTPGPDRRPLGLVHRDVKPSNVRVGTDGRVKLLDFGVARADMDREARTQSGMVLGSLPYMAPELLVGRPASAASDVYALGCTIFEALVGERVFAGREAELIPLLLDDESFLEVVEERLRRLPDPRVAAWLGALLAFEPEVRPSLAEVRAECAALGGSSPALAAWCAARRWPAPSVRSGALSGRVIRESMVDPNAVSGTLSTLDSHAQDEAMTVLRDPSDTLSRPRPADAPPAPPSRPAMPVWELGMAGVALALAVGVVVAAFGASYLLAALLLG